MYRSNVLYESSNFRRLGEFAIKAPWPFYHRSSYVTASATMMPEDDAIIIVMKTLDGDVWLGDKRVRKDESCVECLVHCCSMHIERLGPNL